MASTYKQFSPVGWVFGSFLAPCGILINSMTIYVIVKQRNFLKKHRIIPLLFYLAFFEILNCIYAIPLHSFKFFSKEWPFSPPSQAICKATLAPYAITMQMSVYLLLLITINRALSLYDQNRAAGWFNWKYTSILVFMVSEKIII